VRYLPFEKRPTFLRQTAKLQTFFGLIFGRETEKVIPILAWTSVAGTSAVSGAGPIGNQEKDWQVCWRDER
jgi:hypothetical protein